MPSRSAHLPSWIRPLHQRAVSPDGMPAEGVPSALEAGCRFLEGLAVLELGDGVAGSAAASLLRDLGATVAKVMDPRAPHRRGRPISPGRTHLRGRPQSLLAALLDHGKQVRSVPPSSLAELERIISAGPTTDGLRRFDLVIIDRVGGPPYGLAELRKSVDHLRWADGRLPAPLVTVTAFGLTGPRCDDTATELTVNAACGMLSAVRDPESGIPMKLAGLQVLLSAAQVTALAACHALDLSFGSAPTHLEVSAQEAGIATGPLLSVTHLLMGCKGLFGEKRYGAPSSFFPCGDGLIRISAMEDHQWKALVRAMGEPPWAEQFSSMEERVSRAGDLDEMLGRWTVEHSKDELEVLLQDAGVPATAMRTPAEILESPQLKARGAIRPVDVEPGVKVRTVAPLHPGVFRTPTGSRPPRQRSIIGLKVYEFSHVLAVPLAGALLGAMGAQVTKLEDPARIDMYRRRGPYIDDIPSPERTAYFAMVNHSKSSVLIDLSRPEQVVSTIREADVIMENLGTRTSRRFLVDAESMVETVPDCLCVSSSGFGHTGPMAEYRAYAYNLQSAYGLTYLTRSSDGRAASMDHAWADLISGYAIATLVAAWAVGPGGNSGTGVDFAMGELIASRFNEFLAAASIDPASDRAVDRANETFPFAPNGVYSTVEGWLAISVGSDSEFEQFRHALGDPITLSRPEFSAAEGRWADRERLDQAITACLPSQPASDLAEVLRRAGVQAEAVQGPADLIADRHLTERGFFVSVDHPDYGRKLLAGLPWRRAGDRPWPLRPPPLLGGSATTESSQG